MFKYDYRDRHNGHYKELLEKRIKQLEAQLEEEKRRTQRERMTVTKLQNKLIKVRYITFDANCRL
ncbi:hypothetical protein O3G_MSEX002261 [Manduca sexta]|uniref:Uncharacterized protein n=1 Tax=Manduca sexta TaxID=7130 RepID=A0A921YMI4_MANSE|nr:hypothetical protein O3G_MSEX002261 [Manduca sexta]